ncbi:MAG TPA: proton-conducting transporter membrane subunit [Chloroflexota bacterium]|jgi:NADH-quinone oxidoreductase subunit N|nr:proton-conducting transporter membrane subunit [Chloroflexota bacterium]
MTPPLLSVGVLVAGAVVILLLVGPISTRPLLTSIIGVPFSLVAAGIGLQSEPPLSLAVVGLSLVATIALLLLPVLQAEVPGHVAEAAALLLLATGGAVALAAATDLLQVVVGLETLALSAVTLVALSAGPRPLEAAFKYFVLGALSLAGLLYGLGLIYLTTGSFNFPNVSSSNPLTLVGIVLVALGIAFELAMFPFHWGALDAYTAAAPPLAGYVMSASKLAAAYALGRLVLASGGTAAQLLIWGGALTILWGTFGALAQGRNLRRMLGYSAVTHAGFIALAAGSGPDGPTVAAFYAAVYGSMAMLVFAALASSPTADVTSLGPLRAGALALGLFSLSGIPPTPGFWAKLAVLVVAWQGAGVVPTLIAVFGGVFSVLYYLRPIPELFAILRERVPAVGMVAPLAGVLLAGALVVVLGVFPGVAWTLAAAR